MTIFNGQCLLHSMIIHQGLFVTFQYFFFQSSEEEIKLHGPLPKHFLHRILEYVPGTNILGKITSIIN